MTPNRNPRWGIAWSLAVLLSMVPTVTSSQPVQIYDAVTHGDTAQIRRLLEVHPELVGARDEKGNTPLHLAASLGDSATVDVLIGNGADVNAKNKRGATPLFHAVGLGNVDVVSLLLEQGADVNAKTRSEWTPLHSAVAFGMRRIVAILIEHGADVNSTDEMDEAPLDIALSEDHHGIAEILIEHGAVVAPKRPPEVHEISSGYWRITTPQNARPNILVFSGPDGILLVDTGRSETAAAVRHTIEDLCGGEVKYIINTHMHADHCGGNSVIGADAVQIKYGNLEDHVLDGLLTPHQLAVPADSQKPLDKYYSMRFSGEEIRIIPSPGAHTQEDLIVHFVDSGIVQMGDLLFSESFPYLEGSLETYMEILDETLDVFPDDIVYVAGHGREYTPIELGRYRSMLQSTIDAVLKEIRSGKTLEEIQQDMVLSDWESWGKFLKTVSTNDWIETIYTNYGS
jgi:glyoxylase-like metal-dependent hydrolase (beta-lactamase superfamily II)